MRPVTLLPEGLSPNSRSESRVRPGCVGLYAELTRDGALLNRRSKSCGGGRQDFYPLTERLAATAAKPEASGREEWREGGRKGGAWGSFGAFCLGPGLELLADHKTRRGMQENGPCAQRL